MSNPPDWLADLIASPKAKAKEKPKAEVKAPPPDPHIPLPSEHPVARISIIATQICADCSRSHSFVWLEGVRFASGRMHTRRDTIAWADAPLPHIIEELEPEVVPACPVCLRCEARLDELLEGALVPAPQAVLPFSEAFREPEPTPDMKRERAVTRLKADMSWLVRRDGDGHA